MSHEPFRGSKISRNERVLPGHIFRMDGQDDRKVEEERKRHGRLADLYERFAPDVSTYAMRRVQPSLVDDVVSDVFLVAWRRIDSVPPEPLPWLYGVARKVIGNQLRSARRQGALLQRAVYEATPSPPSPGVPDVGSALARLPTRDRELLLLIAWEGLSVSEAAAALGCSAPATRVRLHRARKRFARALGTTANDGPRTSPSHEAEPMKGTSS